MADHANRWVIDERPRRRESTRFVDLVPIDYANGRFGICPDAAHFHPLRNQRTSDENCLGFFLLLFWPWTWFVSEHCSGCEQCCDRNKGEETERFHELIYSRNALL